MRVFLSWSGTKSKMMAEALKEWLPSVIQSIEPWFSPEDIQKGTRWTTELAEGLEKSPVGIFCLTAENLTSPWILFEAGAISKTREAAVYTLLLDIKPSEVEQPLGQFNHTIAEKDDIFQLLIGVNEKSGEAGEKKLTEETLRRTFEIWWPDLEAKFMKARHLLVALPSLKRSTGEVLEEALELLRNQDRNFSILAQQVDKLNNKAEFRDDNSRRSIYRDYEKERANFSLLRAFVESIKKDLSDGTYEWLKNSNLAIKEEKTCVLLYGDMPNQVWHEIEKAVKKILGKDIDIYPSLPN